MRRRRQRRRIQRLYRRPSRILYPFSIWACRKWFPSEESPASIRTDVCLVPGNASTRLVGVPGRSLPTPSAASRRS